MSVSSVGSTVEMSAKAYTEQVQLPPGSEQADGFMRQNFLNTLFSNKQNLFSSASHNLMTQNYMMSEKFKEYKKQFQPTTLEKSTASEKNETATSGSSRIEEYTDKIARELELQTMNQLVFSVSTRFGSAINQLVRGQ